jgi:hypothetical protein
LAYKSGQLDYNLYKQQFDGITNNKSYKVLATATKKYLDAKTSDEIIVAKLKDSPGQRIAALSVLGAADMVRYANPVLRIGSAFTLFESGASSVGESILEKNKSKLVSGFGQASVSLLIGSTSLPSVQKKIVSIGSKIPKVIKTPLTIGGIFGIGGLQGYTKYQETKDLPAAIGYGIGSAGALVGMGMYAKSNQNKLAKEFKKLEAQKGLTESKVKKVGEDTYDVLSGYTRQTSKLNQETTSYFKIVKRGNIYYIDKGSVYSVISDKSGKPISSSINNIFTGQITPGSKISKIVIKNNKIAELALRNNKIDIGKITIIDTNGKMKDINFANFISKQTEEYTRVLSSDITKIYSRPESDFKIYKEDGKSILDTTSPYGNTYFSEQRPGFGSDIKVNTQNLFKQYTPPKAKFDLKNVATVTKGGTESYSTLSLQNTNTEDLLRQFTISQPKINSKSVKINTPWGYADNLQSVNIEYSKPVVVSDKSKSVLDSVKQSSYFNDQYLKVGSNNIVQVYEPQEFVSANMLLTKTETVPVILTGFESQIMPAAPGINSISVLNQFMSPITAVSTSSFLNNQPSKVSVLDTFSLLESPQKVLTKTKNLPMLTKNKILQKQSIVQKESVVKQQMLLKQQLIIQQTKQKTKQQKMQQRTKQIIEPVFPINIISPSFTPDVIIPPVFGLPDIDWKKKRRLELERKRRLAKQKSNLVMPTLFQSQMLGEKKARRQSSKTGFELIR